jgi:hypothetical protein
MKLVKSVAALAVVTTIVLGVASVHAQEKPSREETFKDIEWAA